MSLVVVAGATGFVGSHLVGALVERGHRVRGGSRDPARVRSAHSAVDWVRLDVDDETSLGPALEGADVLVYLVHHLRADDDLHDAELAAARRVSRACAEAGVRRIVYLGGPAPEGPPSAHLAARLATGQALRDGPVQTIELRAGMIVGVGSQSWLIVRDLALRLPAMVLPAWLRTRSEPVGIDDVVAALAHAVDVRTEGSAWYDLPGPEVLSAREILVRVAAQVGMRPVMVSVPVLTPGLSSHWIRLVSRADYGLARQLVEGLTSDLVCDGDGYWALYPEHVRVPFDEAVRRALAEEPSLPRRDRAWERLARALASR
jgi:uncharacterized protein YbjT (DUF2867 family)